MWGYMYVKCVLYRLIKMYKYNINAYFYWQIMNKYTIVIHFNTRLVYLYKEMFVNIHFFCTFAKKLRRIITFVMYFYTKTFNYYGRKY